MLTVQQLKEIFQQKREAIIEDWKKFIEFPSVSAKPEHREDCRNCANWLAKYVEKIGFKSEILETTGNPAVYGEYLTSPDKPTILFYGHYDVQPVEPLEEWTVTEPFKPVLKGDRLYGRGAQDNKGQTMFALSALQTLIERDLLKCNVKLLLEGDEEIGSGGLNDSLEKWKDRLKADVLMLCDTGAIAPGVPTITMGIRGIFYLTLHIEGLKHDLHSGQHGGMVPNPAMELVKLLATLHDENGRVAVEGFYEGVGEISPEDRALANKHPFDAEEYAKKIGAPPIGGEKGYSPVERRGFRPTVEINGLYSGHIGEGSKTIIPRSAFAKLSARLVGEQDPEKILNALLKHFEKHKPEGLQMRVDEIGIGGPALTLSSQAPVIKEAAQILQQIAPEKEVAYLWEGGSIPIVAKLAKASGGYPLMVGFGLDEDQIHAPNESFSLSQFEQGFLYAAMIFQHFSNK